MRDVGLSSAAWSCACRSLCLIFVSLLVAVGESRALVVNCTQTDVVNGIASVSQAGGGTIHFNCSNTTIRMTRPLGSLQNNVIIDGQNRNITFEYSGNLVGCDPGAEHDEEIGEFNGSGNVLRNLTFRNFLESWQIKGPNNTVENCTFVAHDCSDDAVSTIAMSARNFIVRNNVFRGYSDKAVQNSYGAGLFEGNTFIDNRQPLRGPYNNLPTGGVIIIRNNTFTSTSGTECDGIRYDGAYRLIFENNTYERCIRGVRVAGTTEMIARNNTLRNNRNVGFQVYGSGRLSLSDNIIVNNTGPGVQLYDSGQADLGGGSLVIHGTTVRSSGRNTLRGNVNGDLRNGNVNYTVSATGNCWDHATDAEVRSTDVVGLATISPVAVSCEL